MKAVPLQKYQETTHSMKFHGNVVSFFLNYFDPQLEFFVFTNFSFSKTDLSNATVVTASLWLFLSVFLLASSVRLWQMHLRNLRDVSIFHSLNFWLFFNCNFIVLGHPSLWTVCSFYFEWSKRTKSMGKTLPFIHHSKWHNGRGVTSRHLIDNGE